MPNEVDNIIANYRGRGYTPPKPVADESTIAKVIKGIGYAVLILGLLAALIIHQSFSWTLAISSFISGILFIGFGEIIRLLYIISRK